MSLVIKFMSSILYIFVKCTDYPHPITCPPLAMAVLNVCLYSKLPPISKLQKHLRHPFPSPTQQFSSVSSPNFHEFQVHFPPSFLWINQPPNLKLLALVSVYPRILLQPLLSSSEASRNPLVCLRESISRAGFLALVSASLVFASDPALAFKVINIILAFYF